MHPASARGGAGGDSSQEIEPFEIEPEPDELEEGELEEGDVEEEYGGTDVPVWCLTGRAAGGRTLYANSLTAVVTAKPLTPCL